MYSTEVHCHLYSLAARKIACKQCCNQKEQREKIVRERERITWCNVGKDPEEQSRSEHGGCALPCHHPLSPHKTLQQLFVVSGLCLHVSPKLCALLL